MRTRITIALIAISLSSCTALKNFDKSWRTPPVQVRVTSNPDVVRGCTFIKSIAGRYDPNLAASIYGGNTAFVGQQSIELYQCQ